MRLPFGVASSGRVHVGKRGSRLAAGGVAMILAAPLIGSLPAEAGAGRIATSSMAIGSGQLWVTSATAADPTASANPSDNGNHECDEKGQFNHHCPPPVIPEAPVAILLPLTAGVLLGAAYWLARRRKAGDQPVA